MIQKEFQFSVAVYTSIDEMPPEDALLLRAAQDATSEAYAPYSSFLVGAVALLDNGETVRGTNQENAAYPVGICAERVLLSSVSSLYPRIAVKTIAISYHNQKGSSNHPVSPCGICRQTLAEYEERLGQPIRLIMGGLTGEVYVVEKAGWLLPLNFSSLDMS